MRVTFAYPRTTADGTEYKPDESADLDDAEAKQLVKDGFARPADDSKSTRAQTKTAAAGGRSDSKGSD
ncbi:hypothetical protein ABZ330_21810 [Streptomyces sp. NPDC006172]|uniref:hypothetical protein n=1 Tax=Streptomyces sp. NPDC006172 TaxID=3154470 RepID=UPI0034090EB1